MEERDAESSHWAVISAHYQKQFGTTGSNIVTQYWQSKTGGARQLFQEYVYPVFTIKKQIFFVKKIFILSPHLHLEHPVAVLAS